MANQFEVNCANNPRCEACPIDRLPHAEDRVMAGAAVRSVIRQIGYDTAPESSPTAIRHNVEHVCRELRKPELVPTVVASVAIAASGLCETNF